MRDCSIDDDLESGTKNLLSQLDPNRFIYDLEDLKPILKQIYFCHRDYIKFGYRANPNMTIGMCTKSLFMCHCETGSVWTHLLSGVYFIYHLILLIHSFKATGDPKDP